jgi:hypothetical protein
MMKFATLLVALFAGACTVTASSHEIDPTPLSGTVSGQPWTFVAGSTDGFLSQGEDNFFAVFYPKAYTACGSEPTGPHLIVAIPKVAGDYDMNLSRNMTFTDGSDNKIATDGRIIVTEVTATHVTGGLVGTYDASNDVNGQFDLTICASN